MFYKGHLKLDLTVDFGDDLPNGLEPNEKKKAKEKIIGETLVLRGTADEIRREISKRVEYLINEFEKMYERV